MLKPIKSNTIMGIFVQSDKRSQSKSFLKFVYTKSAILIFALHHFSFSFHFAWFKNNTNYYYNNTLMQILLFFSFYTKSIQSIICQKNEPVSYSLHKSLNVWVIPIQIINRHVNIKKSELLNMLLNQQAFISWFNEIWNL